MLTACEHVLNELMRLCFDAFCFCEVKIDNSISKSRVPGQVEAFLLSMLERENRRVSITFLFLFTHIGVKVLFLNLKDTQKTTEKQT